MKITRFARPALIAGALVMSGAAHAETAKQVIDKWEQYMPRAVETLPADRRENYMTTLTSQAKKDLDQVPCKTEKDAQDTVDVVKKAAVKINQAIAKFNVTMRYGYIPRCDVPNGKMKVDFVFGGIDKVSGGVHEFDKSLVDQRIQQMMSELKSWTRPKDASVTRQPSASADLIHTHTSRLGSLPCTQDPADKLAAYVKAKLQESVMNAHDYLDTRKIDVECRTGRLAITLEAYPIIKLPPNAKAKGK